MCPLLLFALVSVSLVARISLALLLHALYTGAVPTVATVPWAGYEVAHSSVYAGNSLQTNLSVVSAYNNTTARPSQPSETTSFPSQKAEPIHHRTSNPSANAAQMPRHATKRIAVNSVAPEDRGGDQILREFDAWKQIGRAHV